MCLQASKIESIQSLGVYSTFTKGIFMSNDNHAVAHHIATHATKHFLQTQQGQAAVASATAAAVAAAPIVVPVVVGTALAYGLFKVIKKAMDEFS